MARMGSARSFPPMVNVVLMYDALGYPPTRSRSRVRPQGDRQAARRQRRRGLLPALLLAGVGHRRSPATRCLKLAGKGDDAGARRAALARTAANPRRRGRLGRAAARCPAGRMGVPIRQCAIIPTSTTPRSWRWRWTARDAAARRGVHESRSRVRANGSRACRARTAAGAPSMPKMTHYYLNHIPFADHGALLDPPTADVSARCVSMLAPARRDARDSPRVARGDRLSAADSGEGWQLVRPLGHELHLRNLVGALRAECRRPGSASRRDAQRRRVARTRSRTGRRLGRRGRELQARLYGYEPAPSTPSQTAWALLGLMAAGKVIIPRSPWGYAILRDPGGGRILERGAFYRDRFSARLLSALSWLFEIFPALGNGALPQSQGQATRSRSSWGCKLVAGHCSYWPEDGSENCCRPTGPRRVGL